MGSLIKDKQINDLQSTGIEVTSAAEILRFAAETLQAAAMGLEDFTSGKPERKIVGLKNLVTFGRSVTFVLQNLRATKPDFEEWYKPYKEEMESDPLFQYFKEMRNEIEKEGKIRNIRMEFHGFALTPEILAKIPKPPNATTFFIGDNTGGAGWYVQMPDGRTERYMVEMPQEMYGTLMLKFDDQPKTHLGKSIENLPIDKLGIMYLDYLTKLVEAAFQKFL